MYTCKTRGEHISVSCGGKTDLSKTRSIQKIIQDKNVLGRTYSTDIGMHPHAEQFAHDITFFVIRVCRCILKHCSILTTRQAYEFLSTPLVLGFCRDSPLNCQHNCQIFTLQSCQALAVLFKRRGKTRLINAFYLVLKFYKRL